jgi:hypothetical protein
MIGTIIMVLCVGIAIGLLLSMAIDLFFSSDSNITLTPGEEITITVL